MLKRVMDVVVSACIMLAASPLLIVVAIWVKLDTPGPVFHRTQRTGRGNRPFGMYKFRSMVANADRIGPSSTKQSDPRITRSGRFIRKYNIDELPQLINVVLGDMSLVGPRPEIPQYTAKYEGELFEIFSIRPGITDWASVWNPHQDAVLAGAADPERAYEILIQATKLKLQLRYVRTRTLHSDLKIILYTLRKIFNPEFYPRELADIAPLRPGAGATLELRAPRSAVIPSAPAPSLSGQFPHSIP